MSKLKKLLLSASLIFTMLIAAIVGVIAFNTSNVKVKNSTITEAPSNKDTSLDEGIPVVVKPKTYTYQPGEVSIQKGYDTIDYSYDPSVSAKTGVTTTAYEYVFGSVEGHTMAVKIKEFNAVGVDVSYTYSTTKLDTNTAITGETSFTTQAIAEDSNIYVYILVTPTDNSVSSAFNTSVVWSYGKASSVEVTTNNTTEIRTIIAGQTIEDMQVPEHEYGYEFLGWYFDEDCTQPVPESFQIQNQPVYAQIPNLPIDWLSGSKVVRGTSPLPEDLIIPETYIKDGLLYTVTSIDGLDSEFITVFGGTEVKNVTLPDSLTSIMDCAFATCSSLESVNFNNCNLSYLGTYAFNSCKNLREIDLSNSSNLTSIGEYVFETCYGLTSVKLPENIISIGENAFGSCNKLVSIEIPNSVTSIGDYSFGYCDKLVSIEIPNSVISIGKNAFKASGLVSIEIPNSVTSIGFGAFDWCYSLRSVVIPSSITTELSVFQMFSSCSSLGIVYNFSKYSIDGIGEYGFKDTVEIRDLNKVEVIDGVEYYKKSNTEYVALGAVDQSVTSVNIYNKTTLICMGAFRGCKNLVNVTLPATLTRIGANAFRDCTSLSKVTIPSNVVYIGDGAFNNCTDLGIVYNLSSLSITKGSTTNGNIAYYAIRVYTDTSVTTDEVIIDGVRYIKESNTRYIAAGLQDKTKTNIVLDSRTIAIRPYAFYKCSNLTGIADLSRCANLTTIDDYAFYQCNLTKVIFPNSLTTIGYQSFNECDFESVTIPNGVTTIEAGAFAACYSVSVVYNLSSINITAGISTNADGTLGYYAVKVYTDTSIKVENVVIDGVKYLKESDTSYIAVGLQDKTKVSIALDSKTTSIKNNAFYKQNLVNVDFSDCANLTTIGNSAFQYTGLTNVILPDAVESIGNSAFSGCSSLTNIILPNSLVSIGDYAFSGAGLTSITFPRNLTYIGREAFANCNLLSMATFEDTSTWYWTTSSNYKGGAQMDVTDPFKNAERLTYVDMENIYSWYNIGDTVTLNANGGTFEGVEEFEDYFSSGNLSFNFALREYEDDYSAFTGTFKYKDGYYTSSLGSISGDWFESGLVVTFSVLANTIVTFEYSLTGTENYNTLTFSLVGGTRKVFDGTSSGTVSFDITTAGTYTVYITHDVTSDFENDGVGTAIIKRAITTQYYGDYTSATYKLLPYQNADDLPIPVREGYTFVGWFTKAEGGTKVTDTTSDITLYAHWEED